MEKTFFAVWLAAEAIEDLKRKEIKTWHAIVVLLLGVVATLWYRYPQSGKSWLFLLADLLPGLLLCFLSVLTRRGIGMGDALVMLAIGAYRGLAFTIMSLCTAFFLISPIALLLYCLKKKPKTTRLPFFPFLCAGYLFAALIEANFI